jgi:hypothetical protein
MSSNPHWYTVDGELVPEGTPGAYVSPTTILDIIDKPDLHAWQMAVGLDKAVEVQLDSSERGTRVHKACEDLANGLDTSCAEEELPCVLGFVNWVNKWNVEILETELFVISHDYGIGGTVDLVCKIDGQLWIIDLKTGTSQPSHGIQLKAYQRAYFEMTGLEARMGVLRLTCKTKQGYSRVKEYDEPLYALIVHKGVFDWWLSKKRVRPVVEEVVFAETVA